MIIVIHNYNWNSEFSDHQTRDVAARFIGDFDPYSISRPYITPAYLSIDPSKCFSISFLNARAVSKLSDPAWWQVPTRSTSNCSATLLSPPWRLFENLIRCLMSYMTGKNVPTSSENPSRVSGSLRQVPEVVSAVEGHPADGITQDHAGRHQELREPVGIHPVLPIPREIDVRLPEEVDGVGVADVTVNVELPEVELPHDGAAAGGGGREVAFGVGEGEAELDEVEEVDVGAEDVVVAVGDGLEVAEGADGDARKLGVHGYEREVVDDLADHGELGFEVVGPDVADLDAGGIVALRHRLGIGWVAGRKRWCIRNPRSR
ncbi:hypothetical protein MUK42_32230 [Musa troglodytarum]|uniref:Uncharacterized protein n=1 Tax=Musa troglodytarum TaxID=320322 RepID=A0A9E7FQR4_9LILI|nr:hypothetical protein MUK42_32230 [Musa troglodytarum]